MAKRTDIKKILIIGSGPIVIGQAAEFDYAGTQALGIGVAHHRIPVNAGEEGHLHPVGQLPVGLVGEDVDGMAVLPLLPSSPPRLPSLGC